ncbi:uncharacterized protein LOC113467000 [Diaphorina citri]|uniref:Uncharacterized protein LOC113467000 n=1 Tax=Diaphorina citri TaxID=121845 RepID=A0A3Q0IVK0_DIACI|nr:uncharacterized protein LOC113467000 [Diaphorina citri]
MSPTLFNLYAEKLLDEALASTTGIKIGNGNINNIKYADDQAVLMESEGELERMIEDISETGKQYGTRAIITAGKEFVRNILTKGGQQKCILLRILPEAVALARRVKVVEPDGRRDSLYYCLASFLGRGVCNPLYETQRRIQDFAELLPVSPI